jgi:hypothetical protein
MQKVCCAVTCLGGIIKCNHEGIKITGWPTSVVPMTDRLRWAFSGLIGLLSGMSTYVWKRSAL